MAVKIPSKLDSMSPTFQKAWYKRNKMPLPPHLTGSVKQASKEVKPSERVKKLQAKSIQAYGATKGTKVGGEHGSDEVRDTIAPLTRDQHSKVQAAERAAKAAAKKAAPAKPKKPLSQAERMAAIARAVTKAKSKDRFDVPTVDPDDVDHDDLRDVHQSLHVSRSYNEEFETVEEGVATAQKVMDRANVVAKTNPDPKKRFAASGLAQKAMLRTINPTGVNTGIVRGGGNKTYRILTGKVPPYQLTKKTGVSEEVEQIDELDQKTLKSYINKSIETGRADDAKGAHNLYKATSKVARNLSTSTLKNKVSKLRYTPMNKHKNPFEYQASRDELANRKVSEEVELDEVTKQEAEKALGGPVQTRTGSESKGKLPLGFRRARNLARKAMKTGKTVTESTTEVSEVNEMNHGKKLAKMIMAKQSQHPIAQNMGEAIKDAADVGEYDYEGDMAKSQLRSILANAKRLHDMLEDTTNLPEWVQSKITLAEDYILTAANYMEGEMNEETLAALEAELVEEIELFEKAPPGAKYERMVKHIKKGYAKGGLTPKEKSIAYATAWKAYGKKNEEVEQIDEAFDKSSPAHAKAQELVSNYGNRSAARAVYHGDGSATIHTTGDKKVSSATRVDHIHDQAGLGYNRSAEAYKNSSKSKGGLKFKTKETEGKSIYGSHEIHISHKGMKEEVEQIDEVKAVKAYDKEGKLVGRYRSMDHAKQMKPGHTYKEVKEEVVTEAEGKVAVTPKEKDLAAHHGDPTRITYGDVIKARLKSAAAKKMGKK